MKRFLSLIVVAGFLVAGGVVYVGVHVATASFLSKEAAKPESTPLADCPVKKQSHIVIIKDGTVSPLHTDAGLCDTLTITNADNANRLMAFGQHEHHIAYDGIEEKELRPGQSLIVTLDQAGTYLFHDHLQDEVQGTFTVTR
ncbi:MAG TPA: cupredoxin domain-containing protein [Candidatus Saccharimonadia bacterium]|jgi:hypothetical protein|nr:cupredoxin domain-containing protein [Candidatus Saccharimonadia bacterium]